MTYEEDIKRLLNLHGLTPAEYEEQNEILKMAFDIDLPPFDIDPDISGSLIPDSFYEDHPELCL